MRAELSHARGTRRSKLRLWSGLTAEQAWGIGEARGVALTMTADSTVILGRRSRLEFAERVSSAPLDLFTALGSTDAATAGRIGSHSQLDGARTLTHDASVALTRTLGRRSEASLAARQGLSMTGDDRVASASVGGRVGRRAGAFAGWHVGYAFTADAFQRDAMRGRQQRHDLDVGIDYSRPLRRDTSFSLATGSTVLSDGQKRRLRMNATAGVGHQLNRHWAARADYSRPIQFVAGFAEPFLSDALRVTLSGRITRDVTTAVTAGAARGTLGVSGADPFVSHSVSVRVGRRLTRAWELALEYHDARYRLGIALGVMERIPRAFSRRGVRAGVVWAPRVARGRE